MQTERERLVEELKKISGITNGHISIYDVADFILKDRLRVVQPLLEPHTIHKDNELKVCIRAIKQTLKNAGVGE